MQAEIEMAREKMQMELALKREAMMERLAIERFKAENCAAQTAINLPQVL